MQLWTKAKMIIIHRLVAGSISKESVHEQMNENHLRISRRD